MGRKPLELKCPRCGNCYNNSCAKSDPLHYRWSDETIPLFQKIAGQDLSFRERTRKCNSCGYEFIVVEMAKHFLAAMINEIQRLMREVKQLKWEHQNLREASRKAGEKNKILEGENQRLLEENSVMKAKLKAIAELAKTETHQDGGSSENYTGSESRLIETRLLDGNQSSKSVNQLSESSG